MYKSKHFNKSEFHLYDDMNPFIIFILDKLREKVSVFYDCSFNIISSNEVYHKHNSKSKHYQNLAVDFWINFKDKTKNKKYYATTKLIDLCLKMLHFSEDVGFGCYINDKGYMSFHLDYSNGYKRRWMAIGKTENKWNYERYNLDLLEHIKFD